MDHNRNDETINAYWEKNIAGFSGFYDKESEENLSTSPLIEFCYKKAIFPIEKKYMKERYNLVVSFINNYVNREMEVADIGCGSGIYTKILAGRCKRVYALDFAQNALDITKGGLTQNELKHVIMLKQNITDYPIPKVDMAIAIGVLPYVTNYQPFFNNILPYTNGLLFNFLDSRNYFNLIRRACPFLNVRNYSYHKFLDIAEILKENNFSVLHRYKLASGIVVNAVKEI